MRASRWSFALCITSGALLFAMAMALWPTRALADVLQFDLSFDQVLLYEEPTVRPSEMTQADVRAMSTFEVFDPVLQDSPSSHMTRLVYMADEPLPAFGSTVANSAIGIYTRLGTQVIPAGYKVRFSFPSNAWYVIENSTTAHWTRFTAAVHSVWAGTGMSNLQKCTFSEGGYIVPENSSMLLVLINTTGRTASIQQVEHYYRLDGSFKLWVEIPDPTAEQINAKIEEETQAQTDALKDTTGSDSVASGALSQGEGIYQQFTVAQLVDSVNGNIRTAVQSQEADSGVTFPGMTLMGFTIPSVSIDPMTQLPTIATPLKLIVTFTFSAAFLSHIIALVHAIFGIYDYGMGAEMFGEDEPDLGPQVSQRFNNSKHWARGYKGGRYR